MTNKMKPCPFCAGTDIGETVDYDDGTATGTCAFLCVKCNAQGPPTAFKYEENTDLVIERAATLWDTRLEVPNAE